MRGPDGALDVEELTRQWVAWRRLECFGADMGGVHHESVRRSAGAMFRPGSGRCRVELEDRAGRHVPPLERHWHTMSKLNAVLERAGLFW